MNDFVFRMDTAADEPQISKRLAPGRVPGGVSFYPFSAAGSPRLVYARRLPESLVRKRRQHIWLRRKRALRGGLPRVLRARMRSRNILNVAGGPVYRDRHSGSEARCASCPTASFATSRYRGKTNVTRVTFLDALSTENVS